MSNGRYTTTLKKSVENSYDPQIGAAAAKMTATADRAQAFSEQFYNDVITPMLKQQSEASLESQGKLNTMYDLNADQMRQASDRYQQYGIPAEQRYYDQVGKTADQAQQLYDQYVQPGQQAYYDTMRQRMEQGNAMYDKYSLPAQQAYYDMVQKYSAPDEQERQAGLALGDLRTAQANSREQLLRQMAAQGINPNSPQAMAIMAGQGTGQAALEAAAANKARSAAQALGMQLTTDAANFGRNDTMGSAAAQALAGFNPQANLSSLGLYSDAANFGRGGQSGVLQFGSAAQGNTLGAFGAANTALGTASTVGTNQQQGYQTALKGYGDVMGNYTDLGKTSMQVNAQAGGGFGQLLGTLGGAALSNTKLMSDRRLKENIVEIGTLPSGIKVYEFDYKWGGPRQVGVMAQEVEQIIPEAVHEYAGVKTVDYALVR